MSRHNPANEDLLAPSANVGVVGLSLMSARALAVTRPASSMIARRAFLHILPGQRPVTRFRVVINIGQYFSDLPFATGEGGTHPPNFSQFIKRGVLGQTGSVGWW
jgi:hypothetical protein